MNGRECVCVCDVCGYVDTGADKVNSLIVITFSLLSNMF